MGIPASPQPSALQSFLQSHPPPRSSPHSPYLHHLALQVAHNLRYQHAWEDVRIHYESSSRLGEVKTLPRPLLSGLPPKRLYVHPDEQVEVLREQKRRQQEKGEDGKVEAVELKSEREWVLPSHLREKWSLQRFGEVFDGISVVPRNRDGRGLFGERKVVNAGVGDGDEEAEEGSESDDVEINEWRTKTPKRLLLATLDDDSTVVYYIVHDGIVKPRQN